MPEYVFAQTITLNSSVTVEAEGAEAAEAIVAALDVPQAMGLESAPAGVIVDIGDGADFDWRMESWPCPLCGEIENTGLIDEGCACYDCQNRDEQEVPHV